MKQYLANKDIWLDEINELISKGSFEEANELINEGIHNKKFKLTKEDASEILNSCGTDIRYWFIKPLVDIGGKFPITLIEYTRRIIKDKDSWVYKTPDVIKGFKLVAKTFDEESYSDLFRRMKQLKDNNEFGHMLQDHIYRKFIIDISNGYFRNIKEIEDVAKGINKYVVKKDTGRWYA